MDEKGILIEYVRFFWKRTTLERLKNDQMAGQFSIDKCKAHNCFISFKKEDEYYKDHIPKRLGSERITGQALDHWETCQ